MDIARYLVSIIYC